MNIASRPELFTIIAGRDLLVELEAEKNATVAQTGNGYASDDLCALQRRQARRGITGVELVDSLYGWSVRYDSGLQNFGLVASSRHGQLDGSIEDAARFATEWVAQSPECRYAWMRARRPL